MRLRSRNLPWMSLPPRCSGLPWIIRNCRAKRPVKAVFRAGKFHAAVQRPATMNPLRPIPARPRWPPADAGFRQPAAGHKLDGFERGYHGRRGSFAGAFRTTGPPMNTISGLPPKQGLYDPANEHDACGVGFVAHIKGKKSHDIVVKGLSILNNLRHRGATGADPLHGDGAGLLVRIPDPS